MPLPALHPPPPPRGRHRTRLFTAPWRVNKWCRGCVCVCGRVSRECPCRRARMSATSNRLAGGDRAVVHAAARGHGNGSCGRANARSGSGTVLASLLDATVTGCALAAVCCVVPPRSRHCCAVLCRPACGEVSFALRGRSAGEGRKSRVSGGCGVRREVQLVVRGRRSGVAQAVKYCAGQRFRVGCSAGASAEV